jgi:CheY-like chemotaxis protein
MDETGESDRTLRSIISIGYTKLSLAHFMRTRSGLRLRRVSHARSLQFRRMDTSAPSIVHNTCPVSADTQDGHSETRLLLAAATSATSEPVAGVRHFRVLLAVGSREVETAVLPVIRALDARIVQVKDAGGLASALRERGTFDLVLSDSHLSGGTGLGILALARQNGKKPPFIIVQSVHQSLIRVAAGGGGNAVLATRVVNDVALVELAENLLGLHEAPASSRRSYPDHR